MPIFGLLIETLDLAAPLMCSFMLVLVPVFCGFSFAHQLVFGHALGSFRSETQSALTLTRALLGDFDFREMYAVDGAMAITLFLSFIMLLVFFILNMVIAIISENYEEAKNKMLAKDRVDIFRELCDYVVYRAEVRRVRESHRECSIVARCGVLRSWPCGVWRVACWEELASRNHQIVTARPPGSRPSTEPRRCRLSART